MINHKQIKVPLRKEKVIIRLMIILGLFSIANFFYWFVNPSLIEYEILFWLLLAAMIYDTLRIIYLWYHYWNISVPEKPELTKSLTVDVFTTYFPGEPYEMVKDTLLAIQKISYPHTTYLCDEADDEHLKSFCRKHEIAHVTRNNRIDAKAGNINNALKQAKGDLCLVLDPDHVPKETILNELVPYFEDENIGFVQSVQAYYNIKESLVAKGAAEQTFLFYGPIMMSMNSYGTVNAIGANCLFRRKALDSIGGHAAGLSEDMHTAMQLYARGWKSVYVPKALTKGLVPATITSYYKQQLKWSRGTLELLVSVYPKLFRKFTLRQKIHFGILPLHYLSGIIYLIAFLIPVISLYSASIPWKGNIVSFGLIFLPIVVSMMGIKLFIQKWLIHKSERGFHIIGGILQACTWWIFVIGLVYTIFRKKVPYLPTPKEDKGNTHFSIILPNFVIGLVSISSIIYGLSIDYTPFSLFMSGFALLNAIYMFFTFIFAYQKPKTIKHSFDEKVVKEKILNRYKRFGLRFIHKSIFPVIVLVLSASVSVQFYNTHVRWEIPPSELSGKNVIDYLGIFSPNSPTGLTSLNDIKEISHNTNINFSIVSLYLPWSENIESGFPGSLIDSIYLQKSIPMITWEPWINSFMNDSLIIDNKPVFDIISEGWFDSYIKEFSIKLKNLGKPVFIRFAHEFDNPVYPWHTDDENASSKFKQAWIHVYEIFKSNNAQNVIWIWNPWKPENVAEFYPGEEYIDWLGVDILNYGTLNRDGEDASFNKLYQPFHDEFMKLPSTPVIISETGSLKGTEKQNIWLGKAFQSIETDFPEINSIVIFNSKFDSNWPQGENTDGYLDWTSTINPAVNVHLVQKPVPDYIFNEFPDIKSPESDLIKPKQGLVKLSNIKGINLKKGHDWRTDFDVLSRKNLTDDFKEIKNLGINTIKFEGNSVYEYNVLNISKEFGLKIAYGFWIFSNIDFVNDTLKTNQLEKMILKEAEKYKDNENITSWNIQNDVLYNQKNTFQKPKLLYQNIAYIIWLKNLVKKLKEIDPDRPVIVDLEVNKQSVYYSKLLLANIPEIDALGLVVKDDTYLENLKQFLNQIHIHYVYSEIGEEILSNRNIYNLNESFFVTAWQDQYEINKLFFNGITDRKGRHKTDYFNLLFALNGSNERINETNVKILKPATPIYKKNNYFFRAMYYDKNEGWKPGSDIQKLKFEWSMVKCDKHGNYLAIKDVGTGAFISLRIPKHYDYYRLLLTTINGDTVTSTITSLNTPLIQNENGINNTSLN